jgi:hypothetical protein
MKLLITDVGVQRLGKVCITPAETAEAAEVFI